MKTRPSLHSSHVTVCTWKSFISYPWSRSAGDRNVRRSRDLYSYYHESNINLAIVKITKMDVKQVSVREPLEIKVLFDSALQNSSTEISLSRCRIGGTAQSMAECSHGFPFVHLMLQLQTRLLTKIK